MYYIVSRPATTQGETLSAYLNRLDTITDVKLQDVIKAIHR